jgi:FtsH-binding integral membrane protein
MQAQPPVESTPIVATPPAQNHTFVRGILLFHAVQWVLVWVSSYITRASPSLIEFHLNNWGVDLAFAIAWAIVLLAAGCGPVVLRRTPLQWIIYILYTALTVCVASILTARLDVNIIFYTISAITGATLGALVYVLANRLDLSLLNSFLYILVGVAIPYQAFIIFTDIALWILIAIAIGAIGVGIYQIYDVTRIITGSFYTLVPGQSPAGAVLLWLEYILSPLRLVGALGGVFRHKPY